LKANHNNNFIVAQRQNNKAVKQESHALLRGFQVCEEGVCKNPIAPYNITNIQLMDDLSKQFKAFQQKVFINKSKIEIENKSQLGLI